MTRILVDPRRVQVVEMKDGARYPVGRNGSVHISEPQHEYELSRWGAPEAGATGYLGPRVGYIADAGQECACGFNAWSWQKVCPRCGSDL